MKATAAVMHKPHDPLSVLVGVARAHDLVVADIA